MYVCVCVQVYLLRRPRSNGISVAMGTLIPRSCILQEMVIPRLGRYKISQNILLSLQASVLTEAGS